MNTPHSPLLRRDPDHFSPAEAWRHVMIWALLAVAALLLYGFTAVVDHMTQRGELRRVHQGASGSLILPDDLSTSGIDVGAILSLASHKFVGR